MNKGNTLNEGMVQRRILDAVIAEMDLGVLETVALHNRFCKGRISATKEKVKRGCSYICTAGEDIFIIENDGSPSTFTGSAGDFWSNENGWGDREFATEFTEHEKDTEMTPPMGGKWIKKGT